MCRVPMRDVTGNDKDAYFFGRMKTISFNFESALLFDRADEEHARQAAELGIEAIDLLQIHWPNPGDQIGEAWEMIQRLIEAGSRPVGSWTRQAGVNRPVCSPRGARASPPWTSAPPRSSGSREPTAR